MGFGNAAAIGAGTGGDSGKDALDNAGKEARVRKAILLLVAAVMAVAFGPSFAQVNLVEKAVPGQVVVAAEREATPEEFPKNVTGEVVSVEKGRREMIVQPSGWFKSGEVTFAVAEPVVPMLAELQPGDRVSVGYVEAHGQLIARAITKILAESESEK